MTTFEELMEDLFGGAPRSSGDPQYGRSILIDGPPRSGKTALAIHIAEAYRGPKLFVLTQMKDQARVKIPSINVTIAASGAEFATLIMGVSVVSSGRPLIVIEDAIESDALLAWLSRQRQHVGAHVMLVGDHGRSMFDRAADVADIVGVTSLRGAIQFLTITRSSAAPARSYTFEREALP